MCATQDHCQTCEIFLHSKLTVKHVQVCLCVGGGDKNLQTNKWTRIIKST